MEPRNRSLRWWWPAAALALAFALLPWDLPLSRVGEQLGQGLRGDMRRELNFVQQFGGITSVVFIGLVILRMDPAKRPRLPDGVLALASTGLGVLALKVLFGRPRPSFEDPHGFVSVVQSYPVLKDGGTRFSWELGQKGTSELWSMPSSHTSAAFALATVLFCLYPRLGPIVWPLAIIVGLARWLTEAHYLSDVIVGATIGMVVAGFFMRQGFLARRFAPDVSAPAPPAT